MSLLARTPIIGAVMAFARRLRFPTLFFLTAGLFLADLVIPDALPFVDEVLLGLAALVLSRWREEREGRDGTAPVEREV